MNLMSVLLHDTNAYMLKHRPHLHLLFIFADNKMISLQDLEGLLPLLLTGAENCHLPEKNWLSEMKQR